MTSGSARATLPTLPTALDRSHRFRGALAAASGFTLWGVFPVYWKQMQAVSAFELIAHRVTWSLAFLLGVLAWQGAFSQLRAGLGSPAAVGRNLLSSLLLAANWTIYVWGVNAGHVIETSLGYFLVPLMNVALGSLVLHERLRPLQWIAIGLAALGVGTLLVRVGHLPWIALSIAGTWAAYGLLKKRSPLGPIAGLTVETLLLLPLAAGFLVWRTVEGTGALGHVDVRLHAFVLSVGVVTAVPLLLFAHGAQSLRLTTLGLLQYIAPSLQFLLGWLLYREPFDSDRFAAFALIWTGLACYTADSFWSQRRALFGSVAR